MVHKKWFFLLFGLFFFLPMLKFAGPLLFLLVPLAFFLFFAGPHRRGYWGHHGGRPGHWGHHGPWGYWDDDTESPRKYKNDEKPKRQYVETYDGDVLEVIEEPRSV